MHSMLTTWNPDGIGMQVFVVDLDSNAYIRYSPRFECGIPIAGNSNVVKASKQSHQIYPQLHDAYSYSGRDCSFN